jgi:hypothetical protein
MTSLIDRYVYTVLRRVPEQQRPDIERELRTSIDDATDAHLGGGADRDAAVTAALLELGDPDRLADNYAERPQYLIGPHLYPAWRRLLTMLLSVVLPTVVVVLGVLDAIEADSVGDVIGGAVVNIMTIGGNMAFWVTAIFAIMERAGVAGTPLRKRPWTPDDLPSYEPGFMTAGQFAGALVWPVLMIALLVVQQSAFSDVPVLDPANWTFWWPYFIVVLLLEVGYTVWLYRRGGWSHTVTVANAILGVLFAGPLVWLVATERFFNLEFIAGLDWGATEPLPWLTGVVIVTVVLAQVYDVVEVAVRAERARRGLATPVPGTGREYTAPIG